jgi:DNA invertase Pin-like site-specific DNA recombinase
MLIGYARVSTPEQNFHMQMEALEKAGCAKVYQETASGAKIERKVLAEVLGYLRSGDTLVVWRLDRLGRSLGHLIQLINELKSHDIGFKSLVEAIDTTTPTGQFFFQITGAFAELERNLIRERTMAGLASARSRGRNGGRPKVLDGETFAMALTLYHDKSNPVGSICKKFGIAKRTFYRYLEKHRQERAAGP